MKNEQAEVTEDNFNRLAVGIMETRTRLYADALEILGSLTVHLRVSSKINDSLPLQAALLTAVNTGFRCFLGGVSVELPSTSIESLIPWPGKKDLKEIIEELGAICKSQPVSGSPVIFFGDELSGTEQELKVVCNEWQAGVLHANEKLPFKSIGNTPLAGVAAGSMAIGIAFLQSSKIHPSAHDHSTGISLWRPDLDWLDTNASGPVISSVPKKFWILGLGHLGQAYCWALGLFRFSDPSEVEIMLQDTDKMIEANFSAGLLCKKTNIGKKKTRICAGWLEQRRFSTLMTERYYDKHTIRSDVEPYLAICGFDNAASRLLLEKSGFSCIIECGLGGKLTDFDKISMHTFPNGHHTPEEIWKTDLDNRKILHSVVKDEFTKLQNGRCGILAETLASVTISTSFVGAFASALVISEAVRAVNGGERFDTISLQLRSMKYKKAFAHKKNFLMDLAANGFVKIL